MGEWNTAAYRITAARMVTPVIRELTAAPVDAPITYTAGQYVLLGDADWTVPQRSFSIANAPRADGVVTILVTLVAGGATSTWAHGLAVGDEVLLEGPFGTFVADPDSPAPVLLLGAGSGLAPCRALVEDLLARDRGRPVTLLFSGRTVGDVIDGDLFAAWETSHDAFRYAAVCTRAGDDPERRVPGARLPERLAEFVGDLTGWEVFAAGPSGFVTGCAAAAVALGAAPSDIRTEEFFVDPQPWGDGV